MAHTETTLTSKEIFNGHVIRVTYDTVKLETATRASARWSTTTAAPVCWP